MDEHQLVAMVGDGANDCAAIREADIGISFAQNDAAFSAPFSSMDTSLKCVEQILMSGRGAISNATEVFRFYLSCTNFRFIYTLMLVYHASYFGDYELTWITYVFSSILLQFFWSLHSAQEKMTPTRHDVSLNGMTTIFSIVGKWIINLISGVIVLVILNQQSWYVRTTTAVETINFNPPSVTVTGFNKSGPENSSLFLTFNLIQVLMAFAIYFSKDTKKPIYSNIIFTILLVGCIIINVAIFFMKYDAF